MDIPERPALFFLGQGRGRWRKSGSGRERRCGEGLGEVEGEETVTEM